MGLWGFGRFEGPPGANFYKLLDLNRAVGERLESKKRALWPIPSRSELIHSSNNFGGGWSNRICPTLVEGAREVP